MCTIDWYDQGIVATQQRCIKNACSFAQVQPILLGPIAMHMNFHLKYFLLLLLMMWMYEVVKSLEEHVVAVHPNTSQQRWAHSVKYMDLVRENEVDNPLM
jgi:hypothetical protein